MVPFGEILFGEPTENLTEDATNTEITEPTENDATTTENEVGKSTTIEDPERDKISHGDITTFNIDVSDSPYIMSPPPIESPPKNKTRTTPIVVGYNPRKVGRYHLPPNPRPNANRDFRMLDSVTTEDLRQTQC